MVRQEREPILETKEITKYFGALLAVNNVDIKVPEGQFAAVIGPNGAGKTTLFNLITGTIKPTSGQIIFKGRSISHLKPYKICQRGIVRTFQITQVFPKVTVLENVRLAVQFKRGGSSRLIGGKQIIKETQRRSEEILDFLGISSIANLKADQLSHSDQRILELSIAIAQDPEILLLDEPTAGLSVTETHEIVEVLRNISSTGQHTVLLVEHDMDVVFSLASRIIVLSFGEIIADGSVEDIRNNVEVQKAYLGGFE